MSYGNHTVGGGSCTHVRTVPAVSNLSLTNASQHPECLPLHEENFEKQAPQVSAATLQAHLWPCAGNQGLLQLRPHVKGRLAGELEHLRAAGQAQDRA